MDYDKFDEEESEIITLEFEDGGVEDCEVIGVFSMEKYDYIALAPLNDTDDVYLYRYQEFDDGSYEILSIEDSVEFKAACDEFDSLMLSDEEEESEEE